MTSFLDFLHPVWKRSINNAPYSNNINKAVLNAIQTEMSTAETNVIDSKTDSYLNDATGYALDLWGDWFGVYRQDSEEDEPYRERIKYAVLTKRGTIPAIIAGLQHYFNDYVSKIYVYEPYKNIFYTNKSYLNGEDHLAGDIYNYAVIVVQISRPFPENIMDIIDLYRPAGVRVLLEYVENRWDDNASIGALPYVGKESATSYTRLKHMVGLDCFRRGHVNLSNIISNENAVFFKTNNSYINGDDVLSGDPSYLDYSYNYAGVSTGDKIELLDSDTVETIKAKTQALGKDFYALTTVINNQDATYVLPQDSCNFYFILDLKTYLFDNYTEEMDALFPDHTIPPNKYDDLIDYSKVLLRMRANVGLGRVPTSIYTYNYVDNKWDNSKDVNIQTAYNSVSYLVADDTLSSHVNSNGLLAIAISIPKMSRTTTFRLNFIDYSWNKLVSIGSYTHFRHLEAIGTNSFVKTDSDIFALDADNNVIMYDNSHPNTDTDALKVRSNKDIYYSTDDKNAYIYSDAKGVYAGFKTVYEKDGNVYLIPMDTIITDNLVKIGPSGNVYYSVDDPNTYIYNDPNLNVFAHRLSDVYKTADNSVMVYGSMENNEGIDNLVVTNGNVYYSIDNQNASIVKDENNNVFIHQASDIYEDIYGGLFARKSLLATVNTTTDDIYTDEDGQVYRSKSSANSMLRADIDGNIYTHLSTSVYHKKDGTIWYNNLVNVTHPDSLNIVGGVVSYTGGQANSYAYKDEKGNVFAHNDKGSLVDTFSSSLSDHWTQLSGGQGASIVNGTLVGNNQIVVSQEPYDYNNFILSVDGHLVGNTNNRTSIFFGVDSNGEHGYVVSNESWNGLFYIATVGDENYSFERITQVYQAVAKNELITTTIKVQDGVASVQLTTHSGHIDLFSAPVSLVNHHIALYLNGDSSVWFDNVRLFEL